VHIILQEHYAGDRLSPVQWPSEQAFRGLGMPPQTPAKRVRGDYQRLRDMLAMLSVFEDASADMRASRSLKQTIHT